MAVVGPLEFQGEETSGSIMLPLAMREGALVAYA